MFLVEDTIKHLYNELVSKTDFDSQYIGGEHAQFSKKIDGVKYEFIINYLKGSQEVGIPKDEGILRIDFSADEQTELTSKNIPITIFSYVQGSADMFVKKRLKQQRQFSRDNQGKMTIKYLPFPPIKHIVIQSEKDKEVKRASAYKRLLNQMVKKYKRTISSQRDTKYGTLFTLDKAID